MTLKVIHCLQTFSNAIRRTFVWHSTRFQLTVCLHGSSAVAELFVTEMPMLFAVSDEQFPDVTAPVASNVTLVCYFPGAVEWRDTHRHLVYSAGVIFDDKFSVELNRGRHMLIIKNLSVDDAGRYLCSGFSEGQVIKHTNLVIVEGNFEYIVF